MKKTLHSSKIYTENGIVDGYLTIEDHKIQKIAPNISSSDYQELQDAMILPGIIDIHSHGYRSFSAKTIDKNEIKGLSKVLPSIGVTTTLATTSAWQQEEMHMLDAIVQAIEEGVEGTKILGVHMEGPFFNPIQHKATAEREVQNPSLKKVKAFYDRAKGYLKYMTIAPEVDGAHEVMDYLLSQGVKIGCGHTLATYEQFLEAKAHGMQSLIHTGNGMNQIDRREVGLMGGALLDQEIYCEIICDLFHLSKEMLQIMFNIKRNPNRFIMISDSDVLSGVEPGTYQAFNKIVHVHEDGRVLLDDGTINGSSKYIFYGMKQLNQVLGIPVEEIILMSSLNPARYMGIDDKTGSIKEGKTADLIVVSKDWDLLYTYVDGEIKYRKGDTLIENQDFSKICRRIDS